MYVAQSPTPTTYTMQPISLDVASSLCFIQICTTQSALMTQAERLPPTCAIAYGATLQQPPITCHGLYTAMHAAAPWGGARVSRLWSAKGDERCAPPHSDDYKEWSLMQLKREITQRQLKTNPRRRNKDAFVRVLLHHDEAQHQNQTPTPTCGPSPNPAATPRQETVDDPVLFVPTSTVEGPTVYVSTTADEQHDRVYAAQQQVQPPQLQPQQQLQQPQVYGTSSREAPMVLPPAQVFAAVGGMQTVPLTPPPGALATPTASRLQPQRPTSSATDEVAACEHSVETANSSRHTKRQRIKETAAAERAVSEKGPLLAAAEGARTGSGTPTAAASATTPQPGDNDTSTEYLRRKLSLQAARLEMEGRRLELETKREERQRELHTVHLALAQEQLQQAKLTTQKMKTEWIVEQMVQKKRLSDAGVSQEDSSASLGTYLS